MILGCLLDLGASLEAIQKAVESVGCNLEIFHQEKCHIMATQVHVITDKRYHSVKDAECILQGSSLHGQALENAFRALNILANAESRVHGLPKEQAKFHEIGALDALADIAGSFAGTQSLGLERVLSRPIHVGSGFVKSAHGYLPVPCPATLEILRSHEIPWKAGPVDQELLTPTGAAILAVMVQEFLHDFPLLVAKEVGYGAGERELQLPNVLRGLIAELIPAQDQVKKRNHEPHGDQVVQIETNVDDVTGEVIGHLIEKLMEAKALDVSVLPATMKKGRSGNVIRAIAKHEDAESLAKIIIKETGSLGVRVFPSLHRFLAEREEISVQVEFNNHMYKALVKASRMDGELLSMKPEYEDCKRITQETGLALRTVMKKVEEAGWKAANQ